MSSTNFLLPFLDPIAEVSTHTERRRYVNYKEQLDRSCELILLSFLSTEKKRDLMTEQERRTWIIHQSCVP